MKRSRRSKIVLHRHLASICWYPRRSISWDDSTHDDEGVVAPRHGNQGVILTEMQSPGIVLIQMRRKHLILHLFLNLLHRRSLDFDRSVSMPPGHFQESTRDNMENMTVCVRLTYLAALTVGFHVGRKCCWRLEYFETFQAAVIRSLVIARGQMQLQMIQFVVGFPDDNQLSQIGKRVHLFRTYTHLEKGQ